MRGYRTLHNLEIVNHLADVVGQLRDPARYYPWTRGAYTVAPGLRKLGTDFGNDSTDGHLISIDADFARYRLNKEACLAEDRGKYWKHHNLRPEVCRAAATAIAMRLANDFPAEFRFDGNSLASAITSERVTWDGNGELLASKSKALGGVEHTLEGLAFQIQADLAVLTLNSDATDYNSALHICAPSQWAPADKIGRSFFQAHEPVPGFERANAAASQLTQAMVHQGPFIRFVWSVESDDRLNRHPEPPPGWSAEEWRGRRFERRRFWVRTERQTTLGLPEVGAALFFIHVQAIPDSEVLASAELRSSLLRALLSMDRESRLYKGLTSGFDSLCALLQDSSDLVT